MDKINLNLACLLVRYKDGVESKITGFESKKQFEFYMQKFLNDSDKIEAIELVRAPDYKLVRTIK